MIHDEIVVVLNVLGRSFGKGIFLLHEKFVICGMKLMDLGMVGAGDLRLCCLLGISCTGACVRFYRFG